MVITRDRRVVLRICWVLAGWTFGSVDAAVDDRAVVAVGGKVVVRVLENDGEASDVVLSDAPAEGTAHVLTDGTVRYHHTGAEPGEDTFRYSVQNGQGQREAAEVRITISGQLRLDPAGLNVPDTPPPSTFSFTDAVPNLGFWRPTSMESPRGDGKKIFVGEREGKIYVIPDTTVQFPSKKLFLDISARVLDDGNEQGLKGIALHPEFVHNGVFFVAYIYWAGSKEHPDNANVRLSRFTSVPGDPLRADPDSEILLIDQKNDGSSPFGFIRDDPKMLTLCTSR